MLGVTFDRFGYASEQLTPEIGGMCVLTSAKQVLCRISPPAFLGQLVVSYGAQNDLTISTDTTAVHFPLVDEKRGHP